MRIPGYQNKAIEKTGDNKVIERLSVTTTYHDGDWKLNRVTYRLINGVWMPVISDNETEKSEVKHARN